MIVKTQIKFVRLAPVKVRQVIDLMRMKDVPQVQSLLSHLNKRPKEILSKMLNAAVAQAKKKGFSPEQLYVSKIICNNGPSWKRFKAAAFGRAAPIKKRTSHIRIELDLKT